jgi:hypothetical protein
MAAYYNEVDPYAASWLRSLIAAGQLVAGDVDERSILDVAPDDLRGYRECHFFAGIGGWPYALQLAGWDQGNVWTGSCPCQPFSSAGQRAGADDARHLWPAWFRLIEQCRPTTIFGEQVASALVVGTSDAPDEDVQDVLDREATFGILHELQRENSASLQGMRPGRRTAAKGSRSGTDQPTAAGLATGEPGPCACQRCTTSRTDEGIAV